MKLFKEIKYPKKPLVLIIDDTTKNLQVVGNILFDAGYEIALLDSAAKAFKALDSMTPDLILLDIMMPDIDGFAACSQIKEMKGMGNVPIIFLTSMTDTKDIVKGFQRGGVDYITKPFERDVLLARIKIHLDLKFSREKLLKNSRKIQKINDKLTISNKEKDKYLSIINNDIEKAVEYIISLLPLPVSRGKIKANWKFVPSAKLGGDSFGYHWIDDDNFAIYLLDVCYHGIGPALLSVSVLNMLRFSNNAEIDYKEPAQVLNSLNKMFQMPNHNDMFFSIWYGVYNKNTQTLKYSTAGHPPALLLNGSEPESYLHTKNVFIGIMKNYNYESGSIKIKMPSKLYIFSDGTYEFKQNSGKRWTLDEFYLYLKHASEKYASNGKSFEIEALFQRATELHGNKTLPDDFSLLKISFS